VKGFGQSDNNKEKAGNIYSNWMSVDYLNCLKTDLPCECEKSGENFLISLDTTRKFILLYEGKANYDYNLYDVKTHSPDMLDVFDKHYSETLFADTFSVIGQVRIKSDTLLFIASSGKQTKFIFYGAGDNDDFFNEHIQLLNSALTARGNEDLNKVLQSDSLKCFCNWELGVNLVYNNQHEWILEKKGHKLYIYWWRNPSTEKRLDLKIEKELFRKLKW